MTVSLAETLGGATPAQWANDFLIAAHLPVTPATLQFVVSWEYAESAGGGGMFNPLNTTEPWPNTSDFNSVGVKNYTSYQDGVDANATVIHNGYYTNLVAMIGVGTDAQAMVDALVISPWGTRVVDLIGPVIPPPPPPPVWKVRPMYNPPLSVVDFLSNNEGGTWLLLPNGAVIYTKAGEPPILGGMVSTTDQLNFRGRTAAKLSPRTYGNPSRPGYIIIATSGETYIPSGQH